MKRKIFSVLFALVLVCSFSLVTAVPVAAEPSEAEGELVGSYSYSWTTSIMNSTDFDFTVGMGWSGPFPWPPNVYYFFHPDEIPPGGYTEPIGGAWLFENIDFDETAEGQTFSVTSVADDPDFAGFASLLTNGTDEMIWLGYMGDRENIASAGGQKSVQESMDVFSGTDIGTDHPGWLLYSVSLTFNQIYLDPENVNKLVLDFTIDIYAGPPTEVWVDDGFTEATSGWGLTHFAVIQDGIDAVAEGGTILVYPGNYTASGRVADIYKSKLTLKSTDGPEATIIQSAGGEWCYGAIRIRGADGDTPTTGVTIDGFTVYNPGVWHHGIGILVGYWGYAPAHSNIVRNCIVGSSEDQSKSPSYGIYCYTSGNLIENNTVYQARDVNGSEGIGIMLWVHMIEGYYLSNLTDNTLRDNTILNSDRFGICVGAWGAQVDVSGTVISNNTISGSGIAEADIGVMYATGPLYIDGLNTYESIWVFESEAISVSESTNPDGPVWNDNTGVRYLAIQVAIDNASPNDTVLVEPGTYNENVVINESLDLVGAGRETTTIDGNYVGNTITITASEVTLSGFTVTGGYADPNYPCHILTGTWVWTPIGGVVVDGNGGTSALTEITIEDNLIHDNLGNGVFVSAAGDGGEAGNIVIRGNEIYNNGESEGTQTAGISLTYLIYTGETGGEEPVEWRRPKNILVEENNIYDNYEFGTYLCAAKDCVIRLNDISGSTRKGLLLASSMTATDIPSESCTIEENEIHDNDLNGIKLVAYNHHNTFTGNKIYNNGFGAPENRDDFKYGFLLQDGNNNTIEDNVIYNNAGGGLYLWGKGDPDYTYYSTTDNIIIGNIIYDHTGGYGIYIPARAGWDNSGFLNSHINQNDITNNLYGLVNDDTTQPIDAKYNWWGEIGGPSGEGLGKGDSVSSNVTYDPWLTENQAKTVSDGIAYFGSTIPLKPGWNTLSVPLKLKDNVDSAKSANTIAEIMGLGDFLTNENVQIVYQYNSGSGWKDIGASDTELVPCRGYYIKILGTDTVDFPVLYSGELGLPALDLTAGWNLIGSGFGIDKVVDIDESEPKGDYGVAQGDDIRDLDGFKKVATALYSIKDKCSVVVSPSTQGQEAAWGTTVVDDTKNMIVGEAYWVFMTDSAILAGFEVTPIYYLP